MCTDFWRLLRRRSWVDELRGRLGLRGSGWRDRLCGYRCLPRFSLMGALRWAGCGNIPINRGHPLRTCHGCRPHLLHRAKAWGPRQNIIRRLDEWLWRLMLVLLLLLRRLLLLLRWQIVGEKRGRIGSLMIVCELRSIRILLSVRIGNSLIEGAPHGHMMCEVSR